MQSLKTNISDTAMPSFFSFAKEITFIGLFSFIANLLTLTPTVYMLQLFDRVLVSQSELTLITLTLILMIFIATMAFAEWIRSRLLVRAGIKFDLLLNKPIFHASFIAKLNPVSAKSETSLYDLMRLRQFLTGNGLIAFFDLPWVPIYLFVLFAIHPILGWFGISFTFFLIAVTWISNAWSSGAVQSGATAENNFLSYLSSKLRHGEIIEALGMKSSLRQRWLRLYQAHIEAQWKAQTRSSLISSFTKFNQYAQQSLILAIGAWLAIRGELSLGAIIASSVVMGNALRPISLVVGTSKGFIQARQSLQNINTLITNNSTNNNTNMLLNIVGQVSLIELKAFAPNKEEPILDSLDLQCQAGEIVGVVGHSGAGKSTLLRCILGIWPKISGKVLLDGQDISMCSREEIGPHLGYLPQEVELLEGSVAENIARFGELNPEAIVEAAKRVDIHEMILRFPQGYETLIGQGGRLLSGGQRQRIALARALYGMPSLIVLDEPNANLDDVGELALIRTIKEIKDAGKTLFIVSHQRNILALADRLVVLANGQIVQMGMRNMTGN